MYERAIHETSIGGPNARYATILADNEQRLEIPDRTGRRLLKLKGYCDRNLTSILIEYERTCIHYRSDLSGKICSSEVTLYGNDTLRLTRFVQRHWIFDKHEYSKRNLFPGCSTLFIRNRVVLFALPNVGRFFSE